MLAAILIVAVANWFLTVWLVYALLQKPETEPALRSAGGSILVRKSGRRTPIAQTEAKERLAELRAEEARGRD